METNRRCSRCGESGHNIRSCILDLDKTIIETYSENGLLEFPSHFLNGNENKLNKLCQKYGLSISNITDNQKKERLHNIYVTLGSQHTRNLIHQLFLLQQQQRQISLYRPSYLPPSPPRPLPPPSRQMMMMAYLSLFYLPGINIQENNNTNTEQHHKKIPSIQIIVNTSKFIKNQNTDVMDCPVCYEKCCNMIVTECNHSYCQPCILSYINTVNKNILPCPLCRKNIKHVFVFSETSSDLMLQG
jgi:hypothetical protein